MHGVERAIAAIAARQDGVVGREQLLSLEVGRGAIAPVIVPRLVANAR